MHLWQKPSNNRLAAARENKTWVVIIMCLTKQTRHVTCQCGYGGVPGYWDPVSGYQMFSSYFYVSQVLRQTYIITMQPRPWRVDSSLQTCVCQDANSSRRSRFPIFGPQIIGIIEKHHCPHYKGVFFIGTMLEPIPFTSEIRKRVLFIFIWYQFYH